MRKLHDSGWDGWVWVDLLLLGRSPAPAPFEGWEESKLLFQAYGAHSHSANCCLLAFAAIACHPPLLPF
ncbi:hypothetical protein ACLOJK_013011 [Asimina triloba]